MRKAGKKILTLAVLLAVTVFSVSAVSTDWFRNTLDEEHRELYDRIGEAVLKCRETVEDVPYGPEECLRIYSGYLDDHPGIFWAETGISYKATTIGNRKVNTMMLKYTHQDNLNEDKKTFVRLVDQFSSKLKSYDNDWIKLYHIYSYLSKTITYSLDYMDQSMWSVFFDGIGVCAGFARSFQYLALLEGIPSIVVHGWSREPDGSKGEPHLWAMAKIGDEWFHFDPTWGRSANDRSVNYTYFCRSQERIEKTHIIDKRYPIPEAKNDKMSYVSMRRRYMETYTDEGFQKILTEAVAHDEMTFTVEFDTLAEMMKAYNELVTKKKMLKMIERLENKNILTFGHAEDKNSLSIKITLI